MPVPINIHNTPKYSAFNIPTVKLLEVKPKHKGGRPAGSPNKPKDMEEYIKLTKNITLLEQLHNLLLLLQDVTNLTNNLKNTRSNIG